MFFVLSACSLSSQTIAVPTPEQLAWQQTELSAFLHFGVNTFTDREWGEGTESPKIFNPTKFDADKIIKTLKNAGFKRVIITAKHHDGFCLWQTAQTEHSIKNAPYKNGKGDIVKELSEACKKFDVKFGVYLSPWDRHEPSYGTAAYNDFYKKQLRELLTNYGDISEVWFDGAKGENAKNMVYDFAGYWKLVRELQPSAVMFSDVGPDVRWVGNESGNAGNTNWSTINTTGMSPGIADEKYLNTGDANGKLWIPAETDVSIRKGWFYHAAEDSTVKSGKQLLDLYFNSVGKNSLLLLNIPPNKNGELADADVKSLNDFHALLKKTFRKNLTDSQDVSNLRLFDAQTASTTGKIRGIGQSLESKLTDKKLETFIELKNYIHLEFEFKKPITFDVVMLQENIAQGQRIENGTIEFWNGKTWQLLKNFTTIGYKRLIRCDSVTTIKLRLSILKSKGTAQLSEIGVYKSR